MFRETPNSLYEMCEWGMISYKQFSRNQNKSWPEVYDYIAKNEGFQTWSFGIHHIAEYVAKNNIDVASFTQHEWMVHCLKLAKGKMNPPVPAEFYKRFVQPKPSDTIEKFDELIHSLSADRLAVENRIVKAIVMCIGDAEYISRRVYPTKTEYVMGKDEILIARIETIYEGSPKTRDLTFKTNILINSDVLKIYKELEKMEDELSGLQQHR